MDNGFIEGLVVIKRDSTKWSDFIIQTQDGDFHVDFDDGYYHQCIAKKYEGKTVRLGYYDIETVNGEKWVRAGDDNVLDEIFQCEVEEEKNTPKRILKRHHKTINNTVKEVKKEVTVGLNMDDNKNQKPDVIVSMTTWKPRIQSGSFITTIKSILNQKFSGTFKIVITLFKEDAKLLSDEQKNFLTKNNIEIFECGVNLRPHLKYFFTVQRYDQYPVITIDDDNIYSDKLIQTLYDEYMKFGRKYVYSCRTHLMTYNKDGSARNYREWKHEYRQEEPSFDLLATGVGGVLYPPNILKIDSSDIQEILEKSLTADDLFLKFKENNLGIKVKNVNLKTPYSVIRNEYAARHALCISENSTKNDTCIHNLKLCKKLPDLTVIFRICDNVESVHGKRDFGSKKEVIRKCFPTICTAISNYNKQRPTGISFVIVQDNIRKDTMEFMENELQKNKVDFIIRKSNTSGNIGSFKTCFDIALKMDDRQLVLFLEDDYICHEKSMFEIVDFFHMFRQGSNSIFLNPTTDVGDEGILGIVNGKYRTSTILPSKKSGIGIWWRQTWHSTSTFCTKVELIKKYKYVFDEIFRQTTLNQYRRNRIFYACPCFQPLYPLLSHYQKQKTMYWFSEENKLKDITYVDNRISGFNPDKIIDTRI